MQFLVFYALDECGFNLGEVPRYGYAHKDSRVVIKRPGKRGSNYTLILLIQNVKDKGVVHWKLIKGGAKSEDFHDFLAEVKFPTDKENNLLLDNAKIHHANQACIKTGRLPIKELAVKRNTILKYLVAYSPQLNPAELCFNFIRHHIEQCQARTEEKLKLAIEEAITLLQDQDLSEYFRHCWNYFSEEIRPNKKRKPINWSKMLEVKIPWGKCKKIYPSEKWKGLGAIWTQNTQKFVSVQKRIREHVLRSWKLANSKSVKLSI